MANLHIPRRNPSAREGQGSPHGKQKPWDKPRLYHKGAAQTSPLGMRSSCYFSKWFKDKTLWKAFGKCVFIIQVYPDTSNVKTHLLGVFALHLILDKHSSTSPDKGMQPQPIPRCWRDREASRDQELLQKFSSSAFVSLSPSKAEFPAQCQDKSNRTPWEDPAQQHLLLII